MSSSSSSSSAASASAVFPPSPQPQITSPAPLLLMENLPPLNQLSPVAAPASEQLCYVHCNCCDTILAVSEGIHPCGAAPHTNYTNRATARALLCCLLLLPPLPSSSLFRFVVIV